jgi:hypothetical protein
LPNLLTYGIGKDVFQSDSAKVPIYHESQHVLLPRNFQATLTQPAIMLQKVAIGELHPADGAKEYFRTDLDIGKIFWYLPPLETDNRSKQNDRH